MDRARRERRRNDKPREIEQVELVAAVLGGGHRGEAERPPGRDDLIPRSREPGDAPAGAPHGFARHSRRV